MELVLGLEDAATPYSSPLMPGGFLTRGVGFGHVVFATTAFDESHAFLVDGLGLCQSDWLETEIAAGIELEVRFYHCNERHHTVALAKAPFELPQKLHHIMFETNSRDDVGAAFDRAWATEPADPERSRTSTTTTGCSASTSPAPPGSRSRSATAPAASPTTGTATAATTGSAPGATNRSASRERDRPRRARSPHMKIANVNGRATLVLGDEVADIAAASDGRFGPDPMSIYDDWETFTEFAATVTTGTGPLVEADLRCPVPSPRQVFAIGLNYRSHAEESGMAAPPTCRPRSPSSRHRSPGRTTTSRSAATASTGRSSSSP